MTRDAEHTPNGYEDAASVVVNQAPRGRMSNPFLSEEDRALMDFANEVQAWSLTRRKTHKSYGTFGQAAEALNVPVECVAEAVEQHYWMFTHDDGPLDEREIDHDGE